MEAIHIYTDGACRGNPGPGGWAALLIYKGQEKVVRGGAQDTTNNRMELTAAIKALSTIKPTAAHHHRLALPQARSRAMARRLEAQRLEDCQQEARQESRLMDRA